MVFMLGADVLGKAAHSPLCAIESETSTKESVAQLSVYADSKSDNHDETCSDPCRLGQCHFGHCSIVFSNLIVRYPTLEITKEPTAIFDSLKSGPALEGPRRPPKLA